MFCPKCGTELLDDSSFCTNCGNQINKENVVQEQKTTISLSLDKKKKKILFGALGIVLIVSVFLIFSQIGKANLKKELMRDWSRTEADDGVYYTLELDFSDDEIEYIFDSFYITDTIDTFDYKVISRNKIKVDGRDEIFTIRFNDDKTMMIVTPSLTNSSSSENWYQH